MDFFWDFSENHRARRLPIPFGGQRRRPIVELFAPVRADVDADLAAALTDTRGLGQLVVAWLAG